jgi:hypothetical protein
MIVFIRVLLWFILYKYKDKIRATRAWVTQRVPVGRLKLRLRAYAEIFYKHFGHVRR